MIECQSARALGVGKPALMHSVTDYALYPHVAHFTSAPGLFAMLGEELDSLAERSRPSPRYPLPKSATDGGWKGAQQDICKRASA